MTPRTYVLAEASWPEVLAAGYTVAVLPWGATEAHNKHLPYGTDTIQCDAIAAEAGRIAWAGGARPAILPTVPFGVNSGQLSIPMTLNMRPRTQDLLLRDFADALLSQGIRKLVILNGHGGNDFRSIVRGIQGDYPGLFLVVVDWYRVLDPADFFEDPGDHAGEMETALMQHVAPGLVRPLSEAGPGKARSFRLPAMKEGWAWAPRDWPSVTDDTGVGNPAAATAEKGKTYFEALTREIAAFLSDMHGLDPDDVYAE